MTQSARLLAAVRDAADVTGAAQPADLLTHAGMDRNALVRAMGDLAALGLWRSTGNRAPCP